MPKAERRHTAPPSPHAMPTPHFAAFDARFTELIDEIRAATKYLREHHGYSLMNLAKCARLHKNSVMRIADETWLPWPETLRKLDRLIIRAAAKRRGETFSDEPVETEPARKRVKQNR